MARVSTIEPRLREQHGDLEQVIPKLVNVFGQEGTARRLGVKQSWVSRWLKDNGYIPVTQYVKRIQNKTRQENRL
jgi:DNA invertase Pin-like site-specific DNA recombinase